MGYVILLKNLISWLNLARKVQFAFHLFPSAGSDSSTHRKCAFKGELLKQEKEGPNVRDLWVCGVSEMFWNTLAQSCNFSCNFLAVSQSVAEFFLGYLATCKSGSKEGNRPVSAVIQFLCPGEGSVTPRFPGRALDWSQCCPDLLRQFVPGLCLPSFYVVFLL